MYEERRAEQRRVYRDDRKGHTRQENCQSQIIDTSFLKYVRYVYEPIRNWRFI